MAEDKTNNIVITDGKLFAVISYLGILCILTLLLKKDNSFALFHAKQGLILFIGEIIIGIVGAIPILGWAIAFLFFFIFTVLSILGILEALMGRYGKLPIVSDLASKIYL